MHFLFYLFTFTYAMQLTPASLSVRTNNECFCYSHLVAKDVKKIIKFYNKKRPRLATHLPENLQIYGYVIMVLER